MWGREGGRDKGRDEGWLSGGKGGVGACVLAGGRITRHESGREERKRW